MAAPCACGKPSVGRGLCRAHYQRQWKAGAFPQPADIASRFRSKHTSPDEGCWEWLASLRGGYGAFGADLAHRVSWALANGRPIPDGMFVCHACDNRRCVNPDRLFLGTHADNMRDMWAKDRGPRPRRHPSALISMEV